MSYTSSEYELITDAIYVYIMRQRYEHIFSVRDFIYNSSFIKKSHLNIKSDEIKFIYTEFERMNRQEQISKIKKWVYYKPRKSRFGNLPISDENVIKWLSHNKVEFVEAGASAANKIGLSTQLPMVKHYILAYTQEIPNIKLNNLEIESNPDYYCFSKKLEIQESNKRKEALLLLSSLYYINNINNVSDDANFQKIKNYINSAFDKIELDKIYNALPNNILWAKKIIKDYE